MTIKLKNLTIRELKNFIKDLPDQMQVHLGTEGTAHSADLLEIAKYADNGDADVLWICAEYYFNQKDFDEYSKDGAYFKEDPK